MAHRLYRFGDCSVDAAAREFRRGDTLLSLSPKVFDCIAYLIDHRDRAVGRDELIAAVWGKADVSDTLLGQTVLKARRAIGDTGNEQGAIRTIPRFGYRWVAELSVDDVDTSTPTNAAPIIEPPADAATSFLDTTTPGAHMSRVDEPAKTLPRLRVIAALLVGVMLLGVFAAWQANRRARTGQPQQSATASAVDAEATAVLPVDIVGRTDAAWLRLGLMDLVATRLRGSGLQVVPSDNVVALTRGRADNAEAAAAVVIAGTGVQRVVVATAVQSAGSWQVHLRMRGPDATTHDVDASDADPVKAGRAAADRLVALLGRRVAADGDDARDLSASDLTAHVEAALLTDDLPTARHLLETAPAALRESPELRLRLAQIDFRAGQLDVARTLLQQLLSEISAESDPVLHARILNGAGVVNISTDRYAEGERQFGDAIALLEGRNQPAALGQAYTGRAVAYAAQGRNDPALADFSRARVALELAGDGLALARVEANEGLVAAKRGHYDEALAAHLRAAQRFERFGALNELVSTIANAAAAQLMLLQPRDALATTDRAWPIIGRLENPRTKHVMQIERATALAANGRLTEARSLLNELAGESQPADSPFLANVHVEQARLDFDSGQFETAAALAASAVVALDVDDYERERAAAWLLQTRALRAAGKDAAVETRRFVDWAATRDAPPLRAYATLADAEQQASERRSEAARATFAKALALAASDGVPGDIAVVVVSYGDHLIADGELERASAVVGQVARWADRDFASAVLQTRYYRALGEHDAWQAALQRARGLTGERMIPSPLAEPLQSATTISSGSTRGL